MGCGPSNAASGGLPSSPAIPAEEYNALRMKYLQATLFDRLLKGEELTQFASAFTLASFPAQTVIYKENSALDAFYILGEGNGQFNREMQS